MLLSVKLEFYGICFVVLLIHIFLLRAAIMNAEKGYVVVFSFQNTVTCASCDYEEKEKLEAVLTDLYYALED